MTPGTTHSATTHEGHSHREGLTVLELLVTMSLISLLIALLLPAIQNAREAVRKTECQNHLRQLGIAIHQHHETYGTIPAGWSEVEGTSAVSGWVPALLPFLEQTALQTQVKQKWPMAMTETNAADELLHSPPLLICPSDVAAPSFRLYMENDKADPGVNSGGALSEKSLMELPHTNYVGIAGSLDPDETEDQSLDGTFVHRRGLRFGELSRGLSNVTIVGERTARRLPSTWLGFHRLGEDGPARVTGFASLGPNHPLSDECELDSRHDGGIHLLFADGHLQFVTNSIDADVYRRMAQRTE